MFSPTVEETDDPEVAGVEAAVIDPGRGDPEKLMFNSLLTDRGSPTSLSASALLLTSVSPPLLMRYVTGVVRRQFPALTRHLHLESGCLNQRRDHHWQQH